MIFLETFGIYPKQFRKIASFLTHKSTRGCANYNYDNNLYLGINNLVKYASTIKRKGVLRWKVLVFESPGRIGCALAVGFSVLRGVLCSPEGKSLAALEGPDGLFTMKEFLR